MNLSGHIPKTKILLFNLITGLLVLGAVYGQHVTRHDSLEIRVQENTYWWTGVINHGDQMPLIAPYHANLDSNYGNQVQPLMLSSAGEVIWSDHPFQIDYSPGTLRIEGPVEYYRGSGTLRDAYQYANRAYFPPSGKIPNPLLFTVQYNTWIELTYHQNQDGVLTYAKNFIEHDFPPGVLMIDDTWMEDYGNWHFHPGRFPDPKKMMDELHHMGYKVMLWICPFVSADCVIYRDLRTRKYLVTDNTGEPAIVRWWNGASALLDLTNPDAFSWLKSQLDSLMDEYGVDGFKFDAGDYHHYYNVHSFKKDATPEEHSELYGQFGLIYPLNEYRAMWKMGAQPLMQRLRDKFHTFDDLELLVPNMLTAQLMGYFFSCPDLIGGGEYTSYLGDAVIDQELIVRSAQCHALMPMIQFSVSPWRVLDDKHLHAIKRVVAIREGFMDYILELAVKAAETGEPIMKSLEFAYPDQGYARITDQFLLGDRLLVAPVLKKGADTKEVMIPPGKWKSFDGQIIFGPKQVEVNVSLDDLPFFELIK